MSESARGRLRRDRNGLGLPREHPKWTRGASGASVTDWGRPGCVRNGSCALQERKKRLRGD